MRIAVLNWRDLTHPEGGGAERYAQNVCAGLSARGHDVTFFCAAHGSAPRTETVDGYRVVRNGSRLSVYARTLAALRRIERAEGVFDVVVDTQNGVPFWAPTVTQAPVVALVHHVHREQWPVVFSPAVARFGWLLESRLAPAVYRGRQYVAVSARTRAELGDLGIDPGSVAVIHNGTDQARAEETPRSAAPTLLVLGRLVPHKRVELAVDVLARLLPAHPGLTLRVVGVGWWRDQIAAYAESVGLAEHVHLLGFVDETTKHHELASAWVALAPSAKEGWGLNVVDAASHGVPTVAHHGAGGLSESIVDGVTGLLVDDLDGLTAATSLLLTDADLRERLGRAARRRAATYTWDGTVTEWEALLAHVAAGGATVAWSDRDVDAVPLTA